jgi:hypothetical protein
MMEKGEVERGVVWGSALDRTSPRFPPQDSRVSGCTQQLGLKESCVVFCPHSALPSIPDPTFPPWLGPLGGGLCWGWGDMLDCRVRTHQLSVLSLGGRFLVLMIRVQTSGVPAYPPPALLPRFHPM